MKKVDVKEGDKSGPTEAERAENRALKNWLRLLERENEVMGRAATYLPQAPPPGG